MKKRCNPSIGWNVYLGKKWIDKVFTDARDKAEDVKRSLVNHDGYDPSIRVSRERKAKANPAKALSRKLPMSKWKKAKVRRLPGGKFQVKVD